MRRAWAPAACALILAAAAGCDVGRARAVDEADFYLLDPYRPRFVRAGDSFVTRPSSLRRSESFPIRKPPEKRIFVVGGSVAQLYDGEEPTLSRTLERLIPGPVRVVSAGVSGYDSPRDALAVREILGYQPDLVVLMSGVNDGATPPLPPRWAALALDGLRRLPVAGPALARGALRVREAFPKGSPPERGAEIEAVARRFATTVRGAVREAAERGVPVALCTAPVNLRDMPPRGVLRLDRPDLFAGRLALEQGRWADAAAAFRRYVARYPDDAHGRYGLGVSLDRQGRYDLAKAEYAEAWRLGGRAAPVARLNEILRRVAREEGVPLADLEKAFESASPHGLVGRQLMEDDVHWDRALDPYVSATIAAALARRTSDARPVLAPPREWNLLALARLERSALADARALRPTRRRSWMIFRYRVWEPLSLRRQLYSERVLAMLATIHEADPALLGSRNLKEWLRGKLAENEWDSETAASLDVWWPSLLAHVGELYRRLGLLRPAVGAFREALRASPGMAPARLHEAAALAALGDREGARREIALVPGWREDPEVRLWLQAYALEAPGGAPPARPAEEAPPAPRAGGVAAAEADRLLGVKEAAPAGAGVDAAQAALQRCSALSRSRRFAESLPDCETAVRLSPRGGVVWLAALCNAAEARRQTGHPGAAAAGFRRALSAAPADWPRRAEIQAALDDAAAAR